MPDQIQSYKVVSSGGLNANENHLNLSENSPGAATRLINYEPSLFGGYRRIDGFAKYAAAFGEVSVAYNANGSTTGQGEVLAICIFKNDVTGGTTVIAARQDAGAATYSFYFFTADIGWRKYTLDHSASRAMTANGLTVKKLRHVQFNFGTGNKICFVDGVNEAIIFDGTHWEELKSSNDGGYIASSSHNSGNGTGGGDSALNAPALVGVFENHLFLAGHAASAAAIAFSAPNDPYTFEVSSGAGQISAGFDVVQIKPFRDNLFIFGANAIKKVNVNSSGTFAIENVTANVGCVAPDSVLEIGGDLVFMSPSGIRPVAGTSRIGDVELSPLSTSIQIKLVDAIANYDMLDLDGVVIRSKNQLRYFVGDDADAAAAADAIGFIGALTENSGALKWEFGELLGIRTSCIVSDYIGTTEVILHGDYDGNVYQQEIGNSFNSQDIVGVYATPYYDFGETEQRKTMRKINTFVRAEGPIEMLLSVTYDWGDPNSVAPNTYTQNLSGAPTVYSGRGVNFGASNVIYGGPSKPIITSDIQGSGFSTQATFVTVGQLSSYTIQGMVFEFSAAGRR